VPRCARKEICAAAVWVLQLVTMGRANKDRGLTVRFTEEEHRQLNEDMSAGAVVRRAVREYLERRAAAKSARKEPS